MEWIELAANCLNLDVPLDWDNPQGTTIKLHMAMVPAKGGFSEADPLFILAGGPGQAATRYSPLLIKGFGKINQRRDVILIDQRGTGGSTPLECEFAEGMIGYVSDDQIVDQVAGCLSSLEVDVRYFTSLDILKDIEHVRKTLGLEKINIWGSSYGTRLGLLYMKLYPTSICSAILDGVTPPNQSLFHLAPTTAQAAWQSLVNACEGDTSCSTSYPKLDQRFRELLERLRQQPMSGTFRSPISGELSKGLFNDRWLADVVRAALYLPAHASLLPFAIT